MTFKIDLSTVPAALVKARVDGFERRMAAIAADQRSREGCAARPDHGEEEERKPSKPPVKERAKKAKKKKAKKKAAIDHARIARRTAARLARLEGLAASERRERARGAIASDKLLLAFAGAEPARALAKAKRAAGVVEPVHQEIDPGLAAWANGIVGK